MKEVPTINDILECLYSHNIQDFKQLINSLPTGNEQSNYEYMMKYRKGDQEARDMLIYTNLKLVIKEAKKLQKQFTSFELMDTIQVGILGLIEAIENYNITLEKANFCTYAIEYIKGYIKTSRRDSDNMIRRSANLVNKLNQYNNLVETYHKKNQPLPDDKTICDILNITKDELKRIKADYLLNTASLNAKASDDEDSDEIGNLISDLNSSNMTFINNLENKSLLSFLKQTLSPDRYFILYYRVLSDKKINEEDIAQMFCVSRQRINQKEHNTLNKLKKILQDNSLQYTNYNLENLDNILPINPDDIIKYLYFRNNLTEIEKRVFKAHIEGKYIHEKDYARYLQLDIETYRKIKKSIEEKTTIYDSSEMRRYEIFRISALKQYKTDILSIDLDKDLEDIPLSIDDVSNLWKDLGYEQAVSLIAKNKIDTHMDDLLKRYFNDQPKNKVSNLKLAEREINTLLFNLRYGQDLLHKELRNTLLQHKDKFTNEQLMFLEMSKFGLVSRKQFMEQYPNSSLNSQKQYIYTKLEQLYFNVSTPKDIYLSREKYLKIRDICMKKLDNLRLNLLDMFYGIGTKNDRQYSFEEISDITGLKTDDIRLSIQQAKDIVQGVYIDSSRTITIDEKLYLPYIMDSSIDLPEITRNMLKDFLIKGKSYDELSEKYEVTKAKVSHTITEGIRKIDFYRFGILRTENKYTENELNETLKHKDITDGERSIIREILKTGSRASMYKTYGEKKVINLMQKFYKIAYNNKVELVEIDESDIANEVNKHISALLLNDKERTLLSFIHGIKCDINKEGIRYTKAEFCKVFPSIGERFKKIYTSALNTVRASKINLIRPTFGYMSRENLKKYLDDPHLPISSKERELLCYSFELNGYPYKTLNELSNIFDDTLHSIKRRIQRAFVTIFKYQNKEINPSTVYETDIEPYLRYFSKSDQAIIIDKHKHGLNNEQIARKHNLNDNQVDDLIVRLNIYLNDLQNKNVQGFDYNYFWEHIDDEDVPYYGNKELAKKIFFLYYEKRMNTSDIIESLHIDTNISSVDRIMNNLMLSILKFKKGIKKINTYSYEEIRDYFIEHHKEMNRDHKKVYLDYFKRLEADPIAYNITVVQVSPIILTDLMKHYNAEMFDINSASKQDIIKLIKKYQNRLSEKTINTLLHEFNISTKELMNGSDQMKVLRLLASVDNNKVLKATA